MFATAAMWFSLARVMETEVRENRGYTEACDFGESHEFPFYTTFGPLVLDAVAYWSIAQALGGF